MIIQETFSQKWYILMKKSRRGHVATRFLTLYCHLHFPKFRRIWGPHSELSHTGLILEPTCFLYSVFRHCMKLAISVDNSYRRVAVMTFHWPCFCRVLAAERSCLFSSVPAALIALQPIIALLISVSSLFTVSYSINYGNHFGNGLSCVIIPSHRRQRYLWFRRSSVTNGGIFWAHICGSFQKVTQNRQSASLLFVTFNVLVIFEPSNICRDSWILYETAFTKLLKAYLL